LSAETVLSSQPFSEWLTIQINLRGLSGGELSERARVSKAAVYFYLSGARIPDRATILKLADAMSIDNATVPEFSRKPVGKPAHRPQTPPVVVPTNLP
jgi:transcriptional regulator with XRE-family HTH domain